jgi:hypothetical protein
MTMVRVNGAPPATSAVAVNKAEIKNQGSIPYAKITTEATPNTATGKMISGEKRGMGAAMRGGSFKSC